MDVVRQTREGCTLTIDECMAKAIVVIDDMIANAMDDGIRMITDHGATDEEIESFREWYAAQLADGRASNLAKIRSWIERRGSTLQ
jgi:hypothetical protein